MSKKLVRITSGFVAAFLISAASLPAQADPITASEIESVNEDGVAILQGADGKTRTTRPAENGSDGRKIDLQEGDTLIVSEDGLQADIINVDGNVVGSFTAPTLIQEDGSEIQANFYADEDTLILFQPGPAFRDACGKATAGKWTYRIGAGLVCGALGAGSGGLIGGACGLGAAGVEDNINFDSVC